MTAPLPPQALTEYILRLAKLLGELEERVAALEARLGGGDQ